MGRTGFRRGRRASRLEGPVRRGGRPARPRRRRPAVRGRDAPLQPAAVPGGPGDPPGRRRGRGRHAARLRRGVPPHRPVRRAVGLLDVAHEDRRLRGPRPRSPAGQGGARAAPRAGRGHDERAESRPGRTPSSRRCTERRVACWRRPSSPCPSRYRSVFVLREVEALSTAETAACLDVSAEAVKTRLHRARALLREELFERAGVAAPNGVLVPPVAVRPRRRRGARATRDRGIAEDALNVRGPERRPGEGRALETRRADR